MQPDWLIWWADFENVIILRLNLYWDTLINRCINPEEDNSKKAATKVDEGRADLVSRCQDQRDTGAITFDL